ncbi:hypothetical protein COLO4_10676 [Corchorus olitorius]|uniref:Uncharacterized protein n=1 Tax=Corchorus olitorius TaxID=93759 RepID=A0A1R3K7K4_9ROSI|nr:hypothetical protein COLO4_10676 [Corchorus olitorius]
MVLGGTVICDFVSSPRCRLCKGFKLAKVYVFIFVFAATLKVWLLLGWHSNGNEPLFCAVGICSCGVAHLYRVLALRLHGGVAVIRCRLCKGADLANVYVFILVFAATLKFTGIVDSNFANFTCGCCLAGTLMEMSLYFVQWESALVVLLIFIGITDYRILETRPRVLAHYVCMVE